MGLGDTWQNLMASGKICSKNAVYTLLIQSHTYLMYFFYRNLHHGSNELMVLMGKSGASPTECVRRYKHYICEWFE